MSASPYVTRRAVRAKLLIDHGLSLSEVARRAAARSGTRADPSYVSEFLLGRFQPGTRRAEAVVEVLGEVLGLSREDVWGLVMPVERKPQLCLVCAARVDQRVADAEAEARGGHATGALAALRADV